jgi:hypothetical protein
MKPLACIGFLTLIVASGIAHGVYTHRWAPPAGFDAIQESIAAIPTTVEGWATRDNPFEPEDLSRAGIRAHVSRVYTHPRTGKSVTLLLVAGLPGPIAVHTPDVCFRGLGYVPVASPEPVTLLGAEPGPRFWRMECQNPDGPTPRRLMVYWAWNGGNGWEAPDPSAARAKYALRPVLYKLYFVTDVTAGKKFDSVPEFAPLWLTEAAHALRFGR